MKQVNKNQEGDVMIINDKHLIKFLYCRRYRPNIYKILTNEINKFKKENPKKVKEIEELFKNLKEV